MGDPPKGYTGDLEMKRSVKSTQRQMRLLELIVDGTGTASLSGPASNQATLTDNGTGDYTITFDQAFANLPVVQVSPITEDITCSIVSASASAVNILCKGATAGALGSASVPTVGAINAYLAVSADLKYVANFPGTDGNLLSVAHLETGGAISVAYVGNELQVSGTFATDTAADIVAAVNSAGGPISALVTDTGLSTPGVLASSSLAFGAAEVAGTASVPTAATAFADTDADFHVIIVGSDISDKY